MSSSINAILLFSAFLGFQPALQNRGEVLLLNSKKEVITDCKCIKEGKSNISLKGNVKVVESGADFKVRIVESREDLRVRLRAGTSERCGDWRFVEVLHDFTIQFVEKGEDFRIRFVQKSSKR